MATTPRRRATVIAALTSAMVSLAACSMGAPSDVAPGALAPSTTIAANTTVVRVVDGDTIVVSLVDAEGKDEHVRLIGIDTPETKKSGTPVECFGSEASAHLQQLLPEGMPVRIERDAEERDHYGRLLAYVYRATDGLFVNLTMVTDGFAAQLTVPPNVTHAAAFGTAAAAARTQNKGLWSSCASAHAPANAPTGEG